ncbi:N-terminal kinase-like protein isoform X2 [Ylistrum balloti]|uniref:N-terminal kinase-like protein isoform X2 n=1 Tax=Ylistrum balloti TaxID=509963 RepID=UPI002905DD92|nr:N-terminal kinase-like protein isoform X2 [Ylistrum balloti]
MWSFFSRDPTKDFHYEILEVVPGLEDKSIWTLHHGKKKGTNEPVSIFCFDVKGSSESQVQLAKGALKRIKTLRHPNILTFLDGIETEKVIYFATEPVVPLETYLKDNESYGDQNSLAISWGLHQIVKGLSFLVNDCNLIHNNVCMASVFVDPAGEWKLAGVDYMYPAQGQDSVPPVKILPVLEKYDPPEKSDLRRGIRGEKWSSDMWGLGCLIWEVFSGPLPKNTSLKSLGKIPKSLVPNYCELVGANPRSRPNPAKFIEDCRRSNGFLNNSFVDTMMFLGEIQIKDQAEKSTFFSGLTSSLDLFPEVFCKHKILPQLLYAFEYGNAGSAVLAPLFKLGKKLNVDEYQKKIVPCVVKLFSSPDRATRVKLLQQIESFIDYLQPAVVNDQIFPQISTGFMDTVPAVRESTIKAMLHMAPKLNYKNVNEELMKHFARLQAKDEQGGIRTNTTVCLGKIAGCINPQVRQKILISAFLRALKDPFPPARQAGILALAATQNYYQLKEVANRILPPLCGMTMDPEKSVRDQAFKAVKGFIEKLEKVSEDPELAVEMEKDVLAGGSAMGSASSWTGWAVTGMSSLTSKIYSKAKPGTGAPKPTMSGSATKPTDSRPQSRQSAPKEEPEPEPSLEEEEEGWNEDDWGDIQESPVSSPTSKTIQSPGGGWDDGDDDDNWGSLEDTGPSQKPVNSGGGMKLEKKSKSDDWGGEWDQEENEDFLSIEDSGLQPASAYNWGGADEPTDTDFFSSAMGLPKKKAPLRQSIKPSSAKDHQSENTRETPARSETRPKSKSKSPPPQSGWGEDAGWDNDDSWGTVGSTSGTTTTRETKKPSKETQGSESTDTPGTGWGDSGGGWDDDSWDTGSSKSDIARKKKEEREQKRLQRQKELQEKREARKGAGALKLGTKKMAMD